MIFNTKALFFSLPIEEREVPMLRGAIIKMIPAESVLFHGHTEDGLRYSYPLVQYKRIDGRAAIVGIADGIEQLERILPISTVTLGRRNVLLEEVGSECETFSSEEVETRINYHVRNWLPLNQQNYIEYQSADGLIEKYALLERVLTGNILSMFKGLGAFVDFELIIRIQRLSHPMIVVYKKQGLTAFDAEFSANVSLPDNIGLGKGSSIGFGVLNKI